MSFVQSKYPQPYPLPLHFPFVVGFISETSATGNSPVIGLKGLTTQRSDTLVWGALSLLKKLINSAILSLLIIALIIMSETN